MKKLIIMALGLSLLTACGENRDAKDQKLAMACQSGVKSLLAMPKFDHQIASVKKSTFSDEAGWRRVQLESITKNKEYGYDQDQVFTCLFDEGTLVGPFGYKAELMQATAGEETYGNKDGQIIGDMQEFMALTDGVAAGMK